jgi:hypothetical protein
VRYVRGRHRLQRLLTVSAFLSLVNQDLLYDLWVPKNLMVNWRTALSPLIIIKLKIVSNFRKLPAKILFKQGLGSSLSCPFELLHC